MLSLVSNLISPAALPGPRAVAQGATGGATGSGTQLPVARAPLRASDGFSVAVGAREALDISALSAASRNAGEGASLSQVAAKGLGEIADALTRMKELATEAEKTSYSRGERAIMNAEFDALRTEIDSIAARTKFNDIKVLEGSSLAFKVGTGNASQDSITLSISAATVAGLDAGLAADTIDVASDASQALTDVTNAIDALSDIQASVDGAGVRFRAAQRNLTSNENILTALRADLIERPVTIGTAGRLGNLVGQEILSKAAPAIVGRLSSAGRVLLSSTQVQAIEPSQTADRTPSQEEKVQPKAVKRPSAYETAQNTRSSSRGETSQSVDIKA